MIGLIPKNKEGEVSVPVSAYNPPEAVKDLTARIQVDYQTAYNLQREPMTEFNDYSLLDRADFDQKRWNAYREPLSTDPEEAWRYNGIRPLTRNKIIGIVAQMTSRLIIPAPFAQNDQDEEDRMSAQIMRDLMEYNIRNSNYIDNYIMWVTEALVNPAAYFGVGFFERMQTIKDKTDGRISKKDVIDSVYSGFQTFNIPLDEVMISNFNQKELARQRFVFRKRYIEYDEAKTLWGKHDNFGLVSPGVRTAFDTDNSLFYDIYDETLGSLVEEAVYYNRIEDAEIPFVNGVYVGDEDVDENPIKHRDNENRPKYNFAVLGYEHISPRFFYYKSAAWKLGDDDEGVIRMEQLAMDATFLEGIPPTITKGHGQFSEAVMIPGKNHAFEDSEVSIEPIRIGRNIAAAWNAVLAREKSMSESTFDPQTVGNQVGNVKTASEALLLQQNARIALGRFGSMFANSLRTYGSLMMDVIIQHQTIADVEEISDGKIVESYKTFILQGTEEAPRRKIMFTNDIDTGADTTEGELDRMSNDLLDEAGGISSDMELYKVNPAEWRKLKFQIFVDVDELLPLSVKEAVREQRMAQEQMQEEPQRNVIQQTA